MFELYGCPTHYGVGAKGLIKSIDYLTENFKNLQMNKVPEITCKGPFRANLKNLESVCATCDGIAKQGYHILTSGHRPLMIAGDHSAAMGSVSATSVYTKGETGLIWIDAHPDINTDKTTVTGNIHGMPVAALLGLGEPSLTHFLDDSTKLKSGNIVMLGLRDIDPPEAEILKEHHIRYYKWDYIMEHGLQNCLNESIDYLSHCPAVHVSFDIDSMDPKLMPGVSVPVPEGFNEDDVFLMMDELLTRLPVQAMDIVEFNHELDKDDITAGFVTLKDMMVVDVDVDLPQYVIRARKGVESCVFEGLFFILKATKTDLGYISLETEGARIINCRVYNYGTVNQKKTISINGNETIIWGLWNTGNDRTRVNYEGNFTHYEFGNNKYDIYVNGIKQ